MKNKLQDILATLLFAFAIATAIASTIALQLMYN